MDTEYIDHDSFILHHQPPGKGRRYFESVRIISDQIDAAGLDVVWDSLRSVIKNRIPGDVVEFGCYIGTTSLVIRKLLDTYDQSDRRAFHVYDSFEGLPDKTEQDMSAAGVDFKKGKLWIRKRDLIYEFQRAGLHAPIIHKGWFNELTADDVPEHIAFAFLDGDFYSSIIDSLRLVWPRMTHGGKLVVDDYQRDALPGVSRALHDFFQGKPVKIGQQGTRAVIEAP
jgi:O-methyltransferase